jgi:transcriptional regulator with XRE-family HTH domain
MRLTIGLTDRAILEELGTRLERRRVDANRTQAELAEEAGISKRTLERIEAGDSTDFALLIRVLRALGLMEGLESMIPDLPQSPITLLKARGRDRKRARHPHSRRGAARTAKPASPWKWRE